MKQVAHYNKLTKFFEDYLEANRLKPGEVRHYQALWGKPNLDPDPAEVLKQPKFFNNHQIPTKDIIICPETKKRIDIAWIEAGEDNKAILKNYYPANGRLAQFRYNGTWTLSGDDTDEMELDEYFLLTNYRQGTSWRVPSKDELFEVKDFKAESKKKNEVRDIKRSAMNRAYAYREQDNVAGARDIAASLNWAYMKDEDILFDALEAYAESQPSAFLSLLSDPKTEIKTAVKQAMDNGILKYDIAKGTMYMGASALASFSSNDNNFDYLTAFAEWIQASPNGTKVLEGIKKKNKTVAEKATVPA